MASEKDHMSVVICGHVDSGKSTTPGRLLFELGGSPARLSAHARPFALINRSFLKLFHHDH